MNALSVADALRTMLADVDPLPAETVALHAAHRRILASDVKTLLTQPPFAASAMDGYAVRAADVATLPARLKIAGEAAAGSAYGHSLHPGEAVRILTGAPLPSGSDAVVIQENCTREGSGLIVREGHPDPEHIRPRGGDFTAGETLLSAGRLLDARALTLAAAAGHGTLLVRRRPQVAILATGNELVPPGATPGPDQIVSSNPVGLAAMVDAFGGHPVLLGIAPDRASDLARLMGEAHDADILVTTGGASVGDHDLVRPVLQSLGATLSFWKLAMRPGKPMIYGRLGPQRVLGLPGNPVSALITGRVFLVPLIQALLGAPSREAAPELAATTAPLAPNGPRAHFMRALLATDGTGTLHVTAAPSQDSSLLRPLAASNALIVRPPQAPAVSPGTQVPVLRLDF